MLCVNLLNCVFAMLIWLNCVSIENFVEVYLVFNVRNGWPMWYPTLTATKERYFWFLKYTSHVLYGRRGGDIEITSMCVYGKQIIHIYWNPNTWNEMYVLIFCNCYIAVNPRDFARCIPLCVINFCLNLQQNRLTVSLWHLKGDKKVGPTL